MSLFSAARIMRSVRQAPRLNLGCGSNPLPGFSNIDRDSTAAGVIRWDISRGLPLPECCVDVVYSEHMIEHLSFAATRDLLLECHRVLRPGGSVRIATPDLARMVRLYLEPDGPESFQYLEFLRQRSAYPADLPVSQAMILNWMMTEHGHRFVFDEFALYALLEATGFQHIVRQEIGESTVPVLRRLESHGQRIGESINAIETMVMEAVR